MLICKEKLFLLMKVSVLYRDASQWYTWPVDNSTCLTTSPTLPAVPGTPYTTSSAAGGNQVGARHTSSLELNLT